MYDQQRIIELQRLAAERLDELMNVLGIEVNEINENTLAGTCPCHDGADNPTALNIFRSSKRSDCPPGWICHTRHCEKEVGKSLLNFVRVVLSKQRRQNISLNDTIDFLLGFLGYKRLPYIKRLSQEELDRRKENGGILSLNSKTEQKKRFQTTIKLFTQNLVVPSKYFTKRGISPAVLEKYYIGDNRKTYRAEVPVFDNDGKKIIGTTSRSLFDKCPICGYYHTGKCPQTKEERVRWVKWHHLGFNAKHYLYNYWAAQKSIKEKQSAIIVESVGNTLKLVQNGVQNVVGCFGGDFSECQEMLLNLLGCMTIITGFDNDAAGRQFTKKVVDRLHKRYNLKTIKFDEQYNDIGTLTDKQTKEWILPQC